MTISTPISTPRDDDDFGLQLGERLRAVRKARRMSLHDVQTASGQEFKVSVLGSYERGERVISVPRLRRLAEIYGTSMDDLLPASGPVPDRRAMPQDNSRWVRSKDGAQVGIDLAKLREMNGPQYVLLARFVAGIQAQRRDPVQRVFRLRKDDLPDVARILEVAMDDVVPTLRQLGLEPRQHDR